LISVCFIVDFFGSNTGVDMKTRENDFCNPTFWRTFSICEVP